MEESAGGRSFGAAEGRGADEYESTGPVPPVPGGGASYEDDIPF
jgi:hypothetical protein